jgi:RNA polymerase sigma factor (sigma-70 family)
MSSILDKTRKRPKPGAGCAARDVALMERRIAVAHSSSVAEFSQDVMEMKPRLLHYFLWNRCDDPDDLVQETIARAWRRIQEGSEIYAGQRANFYYGVAHNVLREYWKNRRRHSGDVPVEEAEECQYRQQDIEKSTLLHECLAKLPESDRGFLLEYYGNGPDGLQSQYGLTGLAVRLRIHRILSKLRSRVNAEGQGGE